MTVSVGNPQQKFREDAVMPMQVLSLYADPILPELADAVFVPRHECRVFMHTDMFLGQNTHPVPGKFRNCQVANSERCLT
jgi:hypothetical protein